MSEASKQAGKQARRQANKQAQTKQASQASCHLATRPFLVLNIFSTCYARPHMGDARVRRRPMQFRWLNRRCHRPWMEGIVCSNDDPMHRSVAASARRTVAASSQNHKGTQHAAQAATSRWYEGATRGLSCSRQAAALHPAQSGADISLFFLPGLDLHLQAVGSGSSMGQSHVVRAANNLSQQ